MMLSWIAYTMLATAALSAFAALLEHALGGRVIARRFIWIVVMVASVAVPTVASTVAAPRITTLEGSALLAAATPVAKTRSMSLGPDAIVLGAWALVTLLALSSLAVAQVRLRRSLRSCRETRIARKAALVSEDFGPAVVGVIQPRIVVPQWTLSLGDPDQNLVIAHEVEHVNAFDPAVHAVGLALVVLCPWNAALWWQLKRLRLAIELDCDARVVQHGYDPIRYGELLLKAQTSIAPRTMPALALVQRRSALSRRIDALLERPVRSATRFATSMVGAALLVALIAAAPAPPFRTQLVVRFAEQPAARATPSSTAVAVANTIQEAAPAKQPRSSARAAGRVDFTVPPLSVTPQNALREMPRATPAPPPVARARPGGFIYRVMDTAEFRARGIPVGPPDSARRGGFGGGGGAVMRASPTTPPRIGGVARFRPDTTQF